MHQQPRQISASRPNAASASVPALIRPQLVEDLDVWCLFPANKKRGSVYIIGNKELNRYITVPGHLVASVRAAFALFDGNHSLSSIETCLREQRHIQIDARKLCTLAADSGLLRTSERQARAGDIERISLPILDVPINRLSQQGHKAVRALVSLVFPITVAVLLWCAAESWIFPLMNHGYMLPGKAPIGWLVTLISVASIAAHETSHALAAVYLGIKVRHLRIAVYAGVLPFVYLGLAGLYTVSVPKRLIVWLAGIYTNTVLGCGLLILIHHGWIPAGLGLTFRAAAHVNFWVAVVNLVPFLPTDGYYVASTLLRRHNVRVHALGLLSSLLRGEPLGQFSWLAASYLLCSICITIYMIGRGVKAIFRSPETNIFVVVLVLILVAAAFIVNFYQKRGRIQSRSVGFAVNWLALGGILYIFGFFKSLKEIFAHTR